MMKSCVRSWAPMAWRNSSFTRRLCVLNHFDIAGHKRSFAPERIRGSARRQRPGLITGSGERRSEGPKSVSNARFLRSRTAVLRGPMSGGGDGT
eukprot:scaffold462_cov195-Pinguiococcus_pyrenoidosus.AAC.47